MTADVLQIDKIMIDFVIKERRKRLNSTTLNQPLVLFFILHPILIFVFGTWFFQHALAVESGVFLLLCLRMLDKSERYVYMISFDDDKKHCLIYYSQFLFFDFVERIDYKDIVFIYARIRYARGFAPFTLRIKRNKKMVAEIREQHNLGWTNDQILSICKKLEKIKVDCD